MMDIVETIALTVFKVGVNKTNYKILRMLPNKVCRIMNCTRLTKVPVNNRLNQLEKCGLVKRFRGTGEIGITDLGERLLENVDDIQTAIEDDELKFTKRFVNI